MGSGMLRRILGRTARFLRADPKAEMQIRICNEFDRVIGLDQPDFPGSLRLPSPYGKGLPERVVELLVARLSYRPSDRILDVGHAYAMSCHLHMLRSLPVPRHLAGIDIAAPIYNARSYYGQSIQEDITRSSIPDESFDLIWCISALEHFGMDNSAYTQQFHRSAERDIVAIKEMVRVLALGGRLIVTVPFGRYQDLGTQRNYDAQRWHTLLETVRPHAKATEMYFRHTFAAGWAQTEPRELQYVGYYDQANAGAAAIAVAHITKVGGPDSAGTTRVR